VEAPKDVRRRSLERLSAELKQAAAILGVMEADPIEWLAAHRTRRCIARAIDTALVEIKILARTEARRAKDFAAADLVRDELKALGVEIMDTARGTTWKVAD